MDSPLVLDKDLRSEESTERGRQIAAQLFRVSDDLPEELYVREGGRRQASARANRRRRNRGGIAAALLVTASGLLVYGSTRISSGGPVNTASKLPDPAAAGATVVNLPPPNLLKPISPEEATKENAERPFVDRADSPAGTFVLRANAGDHERALTCLTQAIYYEAASEGVDGGRAVAQVVINRMRHPGYPSSICGVVYQGFDRATGCQFTFTCDGSLLRPPVESLWARSRKIAAEALAGRVFAPIGHATSYHADYVLPYWADSLDKTIQIGRHIFYRLRGAYGDGRSFFQRYAGTEPALPDPRPAAVLATATGAAQLASALISDDVNGSAPDVEKATAPTTALVADQAKASLIADEKVAAVPSRHAKSTSECAADSDRKQLSPLGANDMRSSATAPGC
jgi:spore germination cell wall hydrolase CwlJ-like protein